MTPSPDAEWESAGALVGELAELDAAARHARLEAIPDPALRATVSVLLAAYDTGSGIFDRPAGLWLEPLDEPTDPAAHLGERIGAWRLTSELGQGGMGAVYHAVRDEGGFEQHAALKMVRPELVSTLGHDRMRRERQLLARLAHRNIATLFDGGVTAGGRPWFAMELVNGEAITRWCTRNRLDPLARLQLVRQVCSAVQHAHAALVVHRDLKPGNILVTADGTVKLLDFGIAKLLEPDADATGDETLTRWGAAPVTLSYASPEQLDGGPVSTASDIYSLGVVLYELLTGAPPFVAGADVAAHRRAVRETAPPLLHAQVSAAWRDTLGGWNALRVSRWLRGDIERVVQLALRKEPERRYASADQLSRDLEAVILGRPVSARPDSLRYRLQRAVSRNPLASAVTAALAIGLLATGAVAINRGGRAVRAGAVAATEAARAERVTTFLSGILAAPDPWTGDRDVTVREVLDDASRRAARDFGDDPVVEARVRLALAQSYRGLGRYDAARGELETAARLDASPYRFAIERALAEVLGETGRHDAARLRYAVAESLARATGDSLGVATVAADLAWLFGQMGVADSARQSALRAVALRRQHDAPPLDLANALNNLAVVELQAGRPDSAITILDESVALLRTAGTEGEAALGTALGVLGGLLSDQGDHASAELRYRESLAIRRRLFGEGHPEEAATLINLAVNALDDGRVRDGVAITDTLMARIASGSVPGDHALVPAARTVRGRALVANGDPAAARIALEAALEQRRAQLPPGHPSLAFTLEALAAAYRGLGRTDEAGRAAAEAHQILLAAFGPDHPRTIAARQALTP